MYLTVRAVPLAQASLVPGIRGWRFGTTDVAVSHPEPQTRVG